MQQGRKGGVQQYIPRVAPCRVHCRGCVHVCAHPRAAGDAVLCAARVVRRVCGGRMTVLLWRLHAKGCALDRCAAGSIHNISGMRLCHNSTASRHHRARASALQNN